MTLQNLNRHIELTSFLLKKEELSFWHLIKIEPEEWIDEGYLPATVHCFVIAIFGYRVIYYNDIEEGFNIAEFKQLGKLNGGGANQNDFHDFISHVYTFIKSGKPWW